VSDTKIYRLELTGGAALLDTAERGGAAMKYVVSGRLFKCQAANADLDRK